jgi:hypothetical protein
MKKILTLLVLLMTAGLTASAQSQGESNTARFSYLPYCFEAAPAVAGDPANSQTADTCIKRSAAGIFKFTTGDLSTAATINALKFSASVAGLASYNVAPGVAPTSAAAGDVWVDSTSKALMVSPIAADPLIVSTSLQVLPAQTAITTVSTIQVLNGLTAITVPAGALNAVGKTLRICGQFVFSNGATAPLLTLSLKFGSVVVAAPVSSANANTNSSSPALFCFLASTSATGASGTVEAHGYLQENVASAVAGAAAATFPDTVTAASSAIDLTAAVTVTLNLTVSSGPVTTATLRTASVEIIN